MQAVRRDGESQPCQPVAGNVEVGRGQNTVIERAR